MDRLYPRPLAMDRNGLYWIALVWTGWDGWDGWDSSGLVGSECAESRVGPQGPLVNKNQIRVPNCALRRFSLG